MSRDRKSCSDPMITLRVPGPWRHSREMAQCLPPGFRVVGDRLLSPAGGEYALRTEPPDPEFPEIFRLACRRHPRDRAELSSIGGYAMSVTLAGAAGSIQAAQRALTAGAGLVRAGGIGVFIDNSVLAHPGSVWWQLAAHGSDPDALFYAFVNLVRLPTRILSHGMHVLGLRDATLRFDGNPRALEQFLRLACRRPSELRAGEYFRDENGRQFRLHGEQDRAIFPNHPINNPYGRWRLQPVDSGRG